MTNRIDLYRQMLWDAHKLKDEKLARLIQKRLIPHIETRRGDFNRIIPFPAPQEREADTRVLIIGTGANCVTK
jgi:hypothetical protein